MTEDKEEIRSPTERNRLRALTKGYLTEKAAAFNDRLTAEKYQAAAFIKESADAVFVFAQKIGIFEDGDGAWYQSILPMEAEAEVRAKVDGELIEDEVKQRYSNLVNSLRSQLNHELSYREAAKAMRVIDEHSKRVLKEKAPASRR